MAVAGKIAGSESVSAAGGGGDVMDGHCAVSFAGGPASGGASGGIGDHDSALLEVLVPGQDAGMRALGVLGDQPGVCLQYVFESGGTNFSTMRLG